MKGPVSIEEMVRGINEIVAPKGWKLVELTVPGKEGPRNLAEAVYLALKHYRSQSEDAKLYPPNSYMLTPQGGLSSSDLRSNRLVVLGVNVCYLSHIVLNPPGSVRMRSGLQEKWKNFPISDFYEALKGDGLMSIKRSGQEPEPWPKTIG